MKVLGIDIGDRKTGLAIADTSLSIAIPRGTLANFNRDETLAEIAKLVHDENIELIVAGMPYNLKGEISHQAEKTLRFIKHLEKAIDIPIETIDERLTSKASKGSADDDSLAAALILQTWLDRRLHGIGEDET